MYPLPPEQQAEAPASAVRTNLPVLITSLIGRDREIVELKALLRHDQVRLLTLCGPAGIGKTRLSLQVAAEVLPQFEDGVFFVPLAPIRYERFVVSAITQALGLKELQGQPPVEQLQEYLQKRQTLLVLDNFEQVAEAAPLIASLLGACPRLKVLITSRIVLRISAEHQFAVPPLALPNLEQLPDLEALSQHAAVALFVERARTIKPTFQLNQENAAVIAEICHRLDGLPLAIELAVARLKVLSPQALLARLSSRLSLLTDGARDLPVHQQTLRRTIDWSYDLMDDAERRLFCRLGVFVGGCDLGSIEAVCIDGNAERGLLDRLASLLDQSMLISEQLTPQPTTDEPRFRMLETLREYAVERLAASGELELMRRRHAEYYLALAERAEGELVGPKQAYWLSRLEEEHDNVRAALHWSMERGEAEIALRLVSALWRFWHVHGHISDGRRWLESALAVGKGLRSAARARALCGTGWLECAQGDIEQARLLFEESLAISRELSDHQGIGLALTGLGRMVHLQGDYSRAEVLYEESLVILRELGDSEVLAWTLARLGILAQEQGQYSRAAGLLKEGLEHFKSVGYWWGVNWSMIYLGNVLLEQGNYREAAALFAEGLASFRKLGDTEGMARSLTSLGRAAFYQGEVEQAAAYYRESLSLYQDLGARLGIAECLEVLARAVWARDQAEHALQLLAVAGAIRSSIGVPAPPGERARLERMLAGARDRLGPAVYHEIWSAGQSLSPEQALSALGTTLAPGPREELLPAVPAAQSDPEPPLTARELEVLRLVASGLTDAQVARILVLSPRTVNAHLRSIYGKLGVSTRSAAARYASERDLI